MMTEKQRNSIRVVQISGNHDQIEVMAQAVDHPKHLSPCVIEQGVWRIILLDSDVPGEVWGQLAQAQCDFLRHTLANTKTHHVMICLHHHPVAMGSEWIDEIGLKNSADFFPLLMLMPVSKQLFGGLCIRHHRQSVMECNCFPHPAPVFNSSLIVNILR